MPALNASLPADLLPMRLAPLPAPAAEPEPADARGVPLRLIGAGSSDIMLDPVLASDGYAYERQALVQRLQSPQPRSPVTGERLRDAFAPAVSLRANIDAFLAANPHLGPQLRAEGLQAVALVQAAGVEKTHALACARRLIPMAGESVQRQAERLFDACVANERPVMQCGVQLHAPAELQAMLQRAAAQWARKPTPRFNG